jgi:hypothetical protein
MGEGASGWLWLVMDVFGVLILGGLLAYGVMRASRRTNNVAAPEVRESSEDRPRTG